MKQGMRCPHCGFVTFANREVCPKCNRAPDAKPVAFDLLGRLKKLPKPKFPLQRKKSTDIQKVSEKNPSTGSDPVAAVSPPSTSPPETRTVPAANPAQADKEKAAPATLKAASELPKKRARAPRPARPETGLLPPLQMDSISKLGKREKPAAAKPQPQNTTLPPLSLDSGHLPSPKVKKPADTTAAPPPFGSNLPPVRATTPGRQEKQAASPQLPPLSPFDGFSSPLTGGRNEEELFPSLSETASFHEALPTSFRTPGIRPLQHTGERRSDILARQTSAQSPVPERSAPETPASATPQKPLRILFGHLDRVPYLDEGARAAALAAPLLALAGSSTLFGFSVAGIAAEERSWGVVALLGLAMCTPYAGYTALVWRFFRMGKWLIPAGFAGGGMLLSIIPLLFSERGSLGLFWVTPLLQWCTVAILAGAPKIGTFSSSSEA